MEETIPICISTHNIHSLLSRCDTNPNIVQCVQEHWLAPPYKRQAGTNAFRSVHTNFEGFAVSAMKQAEADKIRRGRGFGGTAFIYPKHFGGNIKPLIKYNHERVSVMQLTCTNFTLVIINVYMPFLNRSDLQNAISNYEEILGYIDFIIEDIGVCDTEFIVLGDFNCNLYKSSNPFSVSLNSFISSRDLVCTFTLMGSFDSQLSYTRYDKRSLLDYVFVSQGLIGHLSDVSIGDFHNNHSDHLPVDVNLSLCFPKVNRIRGDSNQASRGINWSKLSRDVLSNYSLCMETALDLIDIPASILHGQHICTDDIHKCDIEEYFTQIVDSIILADATIERTSFRALKPYWSRELSLLKNEFYFSSQEKGGKW